MHFDVFNGDADGICALQQLRQALSECETDLQASLQKIEALTSALKSTRRTARPD